MTAAGGIPMVRHSKSAGAPDPSLILMTDDERCAVAFADGVLTELVKGPMFRDQPEISAEFLRQAGIMRNMLDRMCR